MGGYHTGGAPVQSLFFETEPGIKLAYVVLKSNGGLTIPGRLPLVLIQGLTGVKEDWIVGGFLETLNNDRTILVFDNRGIGESTVPKTKWTMQDFAHDVLKLAQHVGFAQFHLMGISMGGMIAQHVALLAPPNTAIRLVLGCTSHGGRSAPPPPERFLNALFNGGNMSGEPLTTEDKQALVETMMRINLTDEFADKHPAKFKAIVQANLKWKRPAKGIAMQVAAIGGHDTAESLPKIAQTTLIVHGDEDGTLVWQNAPLLRTLIPNSRMLIEPSIGHCFWMMDDGLSAHAIRAFLIEGDLLLGKL